MSIIQEGIKKKVVFYRAELDFLSVSLKLIEKFYSMENRVLVLCANLDEVSLFDLKLWTYSQLSFIPHGSKYSIQPEDVRFCKVWISTDITFINSPVCLVHNGLLLDNKNISQFDIVIDIFNGELTNDVSKRHKNYVDFGFSDIKLWGQNNGAWRREDL
jgi:DNA polymerase IIIc chi subunit